MPSFKPKSIEIYFNEKFPELRFAASRSDYRENILLLVCCANTGRFINRLEIEENTEPACGTRKWIADLESLQFEDLVELHD